MRTVPFCTSLLFFNVILAQTPAATPQSDCSELPAIKRRLDRAESILKDWPNLARYHDANTQLVPPEKKESRVVFMGDSITDSWVRPEFGGFFPGKPYVDRGISGQTTPQMLVRFRPDVIALRPKAVVILAGTNDISGNTGPMTLEGIEDNLSSLSELARAHGIRIVLASLLPVCDCKKDREGKAITQTTRRPPEKITALNNWIKRYAAENGHTYLDYFSAMADAGGFFKEELTYDGLHPNKEGYAVMAPLAEKSIAEAMKKK
ncbi:MAG TPA: SGNH/GDSL hydrolase family protein [Acidobacteriota bacterium]|jgi:lysophospholipase L1-like esterase|nr:SGNH/GDSL hydrolase family protein [Acidobacteriota bacterium]